MATGCQMLGAIPREALGYLCSSCTWCLSVRDWMRLVLGWFSLGTCARDAGTQSWAASGPWQAAQLRNIRDKPAHPMKPSWKQLSVGLCSLDWFPDQSSGRNHNLVFLFPQEMIPFAVVGSDQEYQVNGRRILGRKTKWGTIEGTSSLPPHLSPSPCPGRRQ